MSTPLALARHDLAVAERRAAALRALAPRTDAGRALRRAILARYDLAVSAARARVAHLATVRSAARPTPAPPAALPTLAPAPPADATAAATPRCWPGRLPGRRTDRRRHPRPDERSPTVSRTRYNGRIAKTGPRQWTAYVDASTDHGPRFLAATIGTFDRQRDAIAAAADAAKAAEAGEAR